MNGAADMGGMHGFGPIERGPDERVFHAEWEKKAFALNMAIGVADLWTLDAFRFARESLPPPRYLNLSYYGLWVVTLERLMLLTASRRPTRLERAARCPPPRGPSGP